MAFVAHFFAGVLALGLDAALIVFLPDVTPGGKLFGAVDGVGFLAWGFGACGLGAADAGFFAAAPPTFLFTPLADFFAPAPAPVEGFWPSIAGLPADGGPALLFVG